MMKPWENEPDREEFRHYGLDCIMQRVESMGHWCGYVAVPPGHPLHGKDYWDLDINVHGGLTYAAGCNDKICHEPKPGEPDNVWWFGFDCAHCDDLSPYMARFRIHGAVYRDINYVRRETKDLAEQLADHALYSAQKAQAQPQI